MKRFQQLIVQARDGAPPWVAATPSDEKVAWIAGQLTAPDVADILEWFDGLAMAKDELPDWDGDSRDDISRAQEFGAQLIAALPGHLRPLAKEGLSSRHEQTRMWVKLALDNSGGDTQG